MAGKAKRDFVHKATSLAQLVHVFKELVKYPIVACYLTGIIILAKKQSNVGSPGILIEYDQLHQHWKDKGRKQAVIYIQDLLDTIACHIIHFCVHKNYQQMQPNYTTMLPALLEFFQKKEFCCGSRPVAIGTSNIKVQKRKALSEERYATISRKRQAIFNDHEDTIEVKEHVELDTDTRKKIEKEEKQTEPASISLKDDTYFFHTRDEDGSHEIIKKSNPEYQNVNSVNSAENTGVDAAVEVDAQTETGEHKDESKDLESDTIHSSSVTTTSFVPASTLAASNPSANRFAQLTAFYLDLASDALKILNELKDLFFKDKNMVNSVIQQYLNFEIEQVSASQSSALQFIMPQQFAAFFRTGTHTLVGKGLEILTELKNLYLKNSDSANSVMKDYFAFAQQQVQIDILFLNKLLVMIGFKISGLESSHVPANFELTTVATLLGMLQSNPHRSPIIPANTAYRSPYLATSSLFTTNTRSRIPIDFTAIAAQRIVHNP